MRAAIYTRVSQDKREGRSVSEQEAECRAVCEREGWDVAKVFTENDRSASKYAKKARPEYAKLLAFIDSGQCDVLVTWEASRAQRDLGAYVAMREACAKAGVLWSYSGKTHDLSRSDDVFSTGLDALLAERESNVTQERILRATRAQAAKGLPHGRIPYGYVREYDPTTGALLRQVICEDEAAVIREAAHRFLSGESAHAIAKDFQRRGIPTAHSGKWDLTRVRRLLTSPTINGKRVHKGKVVGQGEWSAILDDGTFAQLVSRFNDPARKMNDGNHGVKFLLSGIARCGVCGGRIRVGRPRGRDSYVCSQGFCVARSVPDADAWVVANVIERLSRPDVIAVLASGDDGHADRDVYDQAADLRARLDGFYDAAAAGEITPKALARIEGTLIAEIEALEASMKRAHVPPTVYDLVADPSRWEALNLEQQREVVRCLVDVRIHRTGIGRRTFDPASVEVAPAGSQPVPA